jgi:hypothetical protein
LFTYKFLINFISKFNSFSLFFIEIFLIRPKKKTMKNIGHRQHRIQPIDHIESTRPNISRCCLFSPLSDEFFYYPLSWLMLIASHRACQKSVLTTKKPLGGTQLSVAHVSSKIYFNFGSEPILLWIMVCANRGVSVTFPYKMTKTWKRLDTSTHLPKGASDS